MPNATCNAMKTSPLSTEHSVLQGSGLCGGGGSMAFPAPVRKHGEGHVAKESACGKCVCPARPESRWKRLGSSRRGGRLYRRRPGCRAFRRPSEQGERAGGGAGEGAPGRTKLASLNEERSRPEQTAWIRQTGMPGPVSVACGRRVPVSVACGRRVPVGVACGGAMSPEEGPGRLQAAGWAWRFKRSRCSAATWDWAGGRTKKSRSGVSERHRRRSGWFCDGRIRSRLCSRSAPWWSLRSRRPGCLRPPPPVARRPCWRFRRRCCWRRGPI